MHAHQLVTGVLLTSRSRLFEIPKMKFNRGSETRADWSRCTFALPANPVMTMQHNTVIAVTSGEATVLIDAAIPENEATTTKASSTATSVQLSRAFSETISLRHKTHKARRRLPRHRLQPTEK
jgi:hypothetical protein